MLETLSMVVPIAVIVYVVNLADTETLPKLEIAARNPSDGTLEIRPFWGEGLLLSVAVFYLVGLPTSTRVGNNSRNLLTDAVGSVPAGKGVL